MSTDLSARLQALEDIEAIRQLKARYLASCDRKDPATMRSCFADGLVEIDYGVVGRFDNADALVKVFTDVGCHDYMVEMHHGVNPQIDRVSAELAHGTWGLHYFLINTRDRTLTQLGGYYEDEYVRTPGGWKMSKTRFVVTSTLVLDTGSEAAKALFAGRAPPAA
ncbi:MAG TPA: nuclear transport factor 2 family protein [Fontimonas sp.]